MTIRELINSKREDLRKQMEHALALALKYKNNDYRVYVGTDGKFGVDEFEQGQPASYARVNHKPGYDRHYIRTYSYNAFVADGIEVDGYNVDGYDYDADIEEIAKNYGMIEIDMIDRTVTNDDILEAYDRLGTMEAAAEELRIRWDAVRWAVLAKGWEGGK